MRCTAAVIIALFLLPAVALANQLQDGLAAFDNKDYPVALKILQPLADQGNAGAEAIIGTMYAQGYGVEPDTAKSFKWTRLAAEHGDAKSQYWLGDRYAEGHGVKQDYAAALRWWRKAAQQDYTTPLRLNLAKKYELGQDGVKQDYAEAYFWYSLSLQCDLNRKDEVAAHLTQEQKAAVNKRLWEWGRWKTPNPFAALNPERK